MDKSLFETREQNRWANTLASFLSFITNPLFVAIPTFFVVGVSTAGSLQQALLWWSITVIGVSLAPLLHIAQGVRAGRYSDHHVSIRSQRLVPFLFGIVSFCLVLAGLLIVHASSAFLATMVAALVALATAMVITNVWKWKISLHLVGVAGAMTTCLLLFGPIFLMLLPLVALVAWARWEVGAHTPWQAIAGLLLAVSITVLIFGLFRFV